MEETLYDGKGHPVAYITEDGEGSIYLWPGHAVAYISEENVFGWNGKHLGWFVEGIIFDLHGYRVGSVGSACMYALYAQPAKNEKYAKYIKYARYETYARPVISTGYSKEPLAEFLMRGAVGFG